MRLHEEGEAICRRLTHPAALVYSLVNQAWLLAFRFSRPEGGLPLDEEAARIAAKHDRGHSASGPSRSSI